MARRCRFSWYKPRKAARDSTPGKENSTPDNARNYGNDGNDGGVDQNSSEHGNKVSDSDFLAAATEVSPSSSDQQSGKAYDETSGGVSGEVSGEASDSRVLNSQGFLAKQMSALTSLARQMASIPNPPGPQSTQDTDSMDLTADQPANSPADQPVNSSADQPASSPTDPPVDSPAIDLTADSSTDPHPVRKSSVRSSSRRKPAFMPPALDALSRRPTRPT